MIITDQKISDTTPYTLSVLTGTGCGSLGVEDRLERVDRAGPDVAEHHAERADHHGQAEPFPRRRPCEAVTQASELVCTARSSFSGSAPSLPVTGCGAGGNDAAH